MIRKHLSVQLALGLLLVSLLPLVGAGFLTLQLMERSITDQVRSNHDQLTIAAAALVRDHIQDGLNKLQNISKKLAQVKDPQGEFQLLNAQVDPPGLLLELNVVERGAKPQLRSSVQQQEYKTAQLANRASNRGYNSKFKQQTQNWSNSMPQIALPSKGQNFSGPSLEVVKQYACLPLSCAAPGNSILTGNLDFRPVSTMLRSLTGTEERILYILDEAKSPPQKVAASGDPDSIRDFVEHRRPVGHGAWTIYVREPRERAMAPLRQARMQVYLFFGIACVMAIGLAALLGGRILRPIARLAGTADRLGRGDLEARTGIRRDDEIGQLAQAFDRMAAAVQQLDQMKGDFVAHVSHELRTPLTSAKMALANVQEGLTGTEALGRVQEDLDRLIRMVNELLDLARIEAGITLARERTDLGVLVRSSVDTLRPLAKVKLEVTGSGESIQIDRARVQQIVVNLVDNALKFAKTRVDVEIRGREVRVTDDGPGVPPEARERVFEKFARIEPGPKAPGAGLGLSIGRKLAQLHGGSLVCEGNTFLLRL